MAMRLAMRRAFSTRPRETVSSELVGKRLRAGLLLYAGKETLPFGGHMWAVPIDSLWS
jgi:hypothetical protein